MRKVNCEACGAPYEVDPRRIPPNGMKMRCPACGASVHVAPEAAAKSPLGKGSLADLDLDLPAPKPPKPAPLGVPKAALPAASLPPVKGPAKQPYAKLPELELSDLPAVKSRSAAKPGAPAAAAPPSAQAGADDDLTDLPAPRINKPGGVPGFKGGFGKESSDLHPSLKKTAPAGLKAVGPRDKPGAADDDLDIDLPAPKVNKPAQPSLASPLDLGPSDPAGDDLDIDLPVPKANKPAPTFASAATPQGLDLDSPLDRREQTAMPKKSFAKPSAATPGNSLTPSASAKPSASAFGIADDLAPRIEVRNSMGPGGSMPKDSLAIEPKPFFASAPPLGMFGNLDEIQDAAKPAPKPAQKPGQKPALANQDLVDLPAPNDLPAVKRANPKATALGLGLGGSMPKDSLDLPAEFGAASAPLPEILGAAEPAPAFGLEDTSTRNALATPSMSELDLPAPRDLPAVKKRPPPKATALGLGAPIASAPKGSFEVQLLGAPSSGGGASASALRSHAEEPRPAATRGAELSLDLPPMSAREGARPELDLGEFERALDNIESKGGGSFGAFGADLDLPPRGGQKRDAGSFGDLEPIALPSAAASNNNTMPAHTMELGATDLMFGGADRGISFGDASGGPAPSSRRADLGLELANDLSSPPPSSRDAGNFGELDLGLGRESSVGIPIAISPRRGLDAKQSFAPRIEDAELVEEAGADEYEDRLKRRRNKKAGKSLPAWAIPVALVAVIGSSGVALGLFTEHGWFGVYLMEQLLPAAGNAEQVRTAIEQAERQAKTDSYVDVRRSLVTLSDARNEAGLNRELLARSLLHEALYQLRFGEDAQSAQRSAAILSRVLERGANVPGLALARAADAARRSELGQAKSLLAQADKNDRYYGLVAGELALLEKQPEVAASAFGDAVKRGEVARGQWGLARAQLSAQKLAEAELAAKAVLAASPRHAPAHTLLAQQALTRGAIDEAFAHARIAAGATPIDGATARPSRAERARALAVEGRVEEKRDHPREAQAAYEQALAGDPFSVPDLLGSGRMLMRLGRPQDALSRFDSALNAKPSTTAGVDGRIPLLDAGLGALQAMLALQRPQEALARATALLAQFPNDPEVKLWHGSSLEALERLDEAEADYRETMEKAPKLFSGYVALSQLLFRRGRPEEAARVLSLASGKVDDSAEVRRMLGNSELVRTHLPEAVHQFEAALHFDPNDPGALFGLATAQRKSGAIDAASATIDRLEKADPTFPGLALERGQIFENRGDYVAAIEAYRKALAQRPGDSELKLRLGAALVTAGQVDEAEGVLGQVLKERPTSAEAEHYLGRVLFARKETAQAAQRFERAVNFDTLRADYHLYLAWALLEQGNFGGALESVQKAIERDPNLGDARWILGRIQLRTGAVKDALVNFQAALRLKPGRVEALAAMGDAYDELRDLNQAIKSYQDALKRAPENAEWWYRMGQLHLDKGHRDDARVALAEAVMRGDRMRDRPSWLAEAHRAYGDVLRESKRAAEAADHYRLFLELAPLGHPDRAEIEQLLYQTRR